MFYPKRAELVDFTLMAQRRFCVYDIGRHTPPKHCDCKYGATSDSLAQMSESGNGCPEMRALHRIISRLTEAEYEEFVAD